MKTEDVEIVERTRPYDGYFKIDRYRLKHRLFEGGWSGEMERELFERGHAAAVLLYDPEKEKLIFVEQFRIGALAAITHSHWYPDDTSPWLLETVAGIIDEGETPEDVVRREAVEEADCTVTDLIPILHYMVSPGGTSESLFVFCGRVEAPEGGGIHGLTEEHENIRVVVLDVEEAFALLDAGRIVNSMTIIPLQWFRMNRDKVREAFLNRTGPLANMSGF